MAMTAIRRIGVVGLGAMGAGIAQLCIEAGLETVGHEVEADRGEAARHVAQLLAIARCVHIEEDDRKRAALLRMDDEAVHRAVGGGNVEMVFDHG